MMITQKDIYQAISDERQYQDRKWGHNPHTVGEWILILQSEIQEARDEWVRNGGDIPALREILQVATVAVAAMEEHGVEGRVIQRAQAEAGNP